MILVDTRVRVTSAFRMKELVVFPLFSGSQEQKYSTVLKFTHPFKWEDLRQMADSCSGQPWIHSLKLQRGNGN